MENTTTRENNNDENPDVPDNYDEELNRRFMARIQELADLILEGYELDRVAEENQRLEDEIEDMRDDAEVLRILINIQDQDQ